MEIVSLQGIVDKQVDEISFKVVLKDLKPKMNMHIMKYEMKWKKLKKDFNVFEKELVMNTFRRIYLKDMKREWMQENI